VSDQSSDQKIEQLVRSVLAAVDQRLQEVREEVHALAAEVEQRHQEMSRLVQDLERKMDRAAADARPPAGANDPLAARMEQATQVLLERIEAMHQRTTMATNERFAAMNATLDQLRANPTPPAAGTSPFQVLDAMDAPLKLATVTGQHTIVAPLLPTPPMIVHTPEPERPATERPATDRPATERAMPERPQQKSPAATANADAPGPAPAAEVVPDGGIDIHQLADLLSERLGHLSLPIRSD